MSAWLVVAIICDAALGILAFCCTVRLLMLLVDMRRERLRGRVRRLLLLALVAGVSWAAVAAYGPSTFAQVKAAVGGAAEGAGEPGLVAPLVIVVLVCVAAAAAATIITLARAQRTGGPRKSERNTP